MNGVNAVPARRLTPRWPLAALLALLLGQGCAPPDLVVSITFDDGFAEDALAAKLLEERGFRGTFFIIGGYIGHNSYVTLDQLHAIAFAGHEIGGHTVSHPHLPTVALDDAERQICDDRATLLSYGFEPRAFAYPYGDYTPALEVIAAKCGYEVARIVGPITDPGAPFAEQIPPRNPQAVITPWAVLNTTTVEEMEGWVTDAEAVGGWLPIVFHHLCVPGPPCAEYGITVADFITFLDWLKTRKGVAIRTVRDVAGGSLRPRTVLQNPVMNPSLEGNDGGLPLGWQRGGSGVNDATWTTTSDAHTGASAQRVDISTYTSGSAVLVPALRIFAPAAQAGHRYLVNGWYHSSAAPRWVIYRRDGAGSWAWWTQSPKLTPAEGWTRTTWLTPPLPESATGIGFGLSLSSVGSLTVDDFSVADPALALVR